MSNSMNLSQPEQARKEKLPNSSSIFCRSLLVCAPAFAYLLFEVTSRAGYISNGVALRLAAANRLLSEHALPYIDFYEPSTPLCFFFAQLPLLFVGLFRSIGIQTVTQLLVLVCIFLSLSLTAMIFDAASKSRGESASEADHLTQLAFVASIAIASVLCRFELGELQHFLFLSMAPWVCLRKFTWESVTVPARLRAATGFITGIACSLDPAFLLCPIALELAMLAYYKFRAVLVRPANSKAECIAFLLGASLQALYLFTLPITVTSAFTKWVIPINFLGYQIFNGELWRIGGSPDRSDVAYGIAFALTIALTLTSKLPILAHLSCLLCFGMFLALLEQQGLSKDFILVQYGITAISCVAFAHALHHLLKRVTADSRKQTSAALFAMSTCILAFCGFMHLRFDTNFNSWKQAASDKEAVSTFVKSHTNIGTSIPILSLGDGRTDQLDLSTCRRTGYLIDSKPLRLLDFLRKENNLSRDLNSFDTHIKNHLFDDINSGHADFVFLRIGPEQAFLKHAGLEPTLKLNYQLRGRFFGPRANREPAERAGRNTVEVFSKRE